MTASNRPTDSNASWLGYLTYVDLPSLGTVGGLLIVDRRARPIEFHCSAPIQPTRTQEILYGKTLRSTLVCDQIGKSLTDQLSKLPHIVLTNEPMALGLRELLDVPIGLFRPEPTTPQLTDHSTLVESDEEFELDGYQFMVSADSSSDATSIRSALGESVGNWDWMEPIDRICEAIREAYRAAA